MPILPRNPGEGVIGPEAIDQLAVDLVNSASDNCLRPAQVGGDVGLLHMVVA